MARAVEIASLAPSAVRDRLVDRFHADHYRLYGQIARQFRSRSGVPARFHDDLVQIVAQRSNALLSSLGRAESREVFARVLHRRAWSTLRDWSYSGERTGIAAGSGAARRSVTTRRVTQDLQARLGRFPSSSEIIEGANAEMRSRLSDPRKNGMVFDERDLVGLTMIASEAPPESVSVEDRPPLERHEMAVLVDEAIRTASKCADELIVQLAAAYLACFTEGDGTVVTSQLAAHVGRSPDWVRRALPQVHDICREVLAEHLGITSFDLS
jgi:hypothetical protein